MLKTNLKSSLGTSHGKIILMGEHAVVYGEPALAMPFPAARVKVSIKESTGPITLDCRYYTGELSKAPEHLRNIQAIIDATVLELGLPLENMAINIESTIPAERGMGSSAAVAAAVIRALYDFAQTPLEHDQLLRLVDIAEVIAHGNPSGLDALMTSSDLPVYFKKEHPFETFPLSINAYLIVADSGQMGQTKEAVGDIAKLKEQDSKTISKKIQQLGIIAEEAKKAILNNDAHALGKNMTQAHSLLAELTVSNEKLDFLVKEAIDAGALGAKLTGGGRGGCMIALATSKEDAERISSALIEAGAKNTWLHSLGDDSIVE